MNDCEACRFNKAVGELLNIPDMDGPIMMSMRFGKIHSRSLALKKGEQ